MATGTIIPQLKQSCTILTEWRNNWTNNGQCFFAVTGHVAHIHATIRNGTATTGTEIADVTSAYAPSTATLAPILKSSGVGNGYVQINTQGKVTINSVTDNTSVLFDLFWAI